MASQVPGPICTLQLGDDWIDAGTMCLARTQPPGHNPWRRDPFAADKRAAKRVYSRAREAAWKRRFDEQLALAGVNIAADNGLYWRSLIGCLADDAVFKVKMRRFLGRIYVIDLPAA